MNKLNQYTLWEGRQLEKRTDPGGGYFKFYLVYEITLWINNNEAEIVSIHWTEFCKETLIEINIENNTKDTHELLSLLFSKLPTQTKLLTPKDFIKTLNEIGCHENKDEE